jgi:type I restriction enzyme S subunit
VKSVRQKLIVCDKVYRIKVNKDKILSEYLTMLLNTPQLQDEIEIIKSGISDSGLNLTQDRFLSLTLKLPSLQMQGIILAEIERRLSNIAYMESQIDNVLATSEALRQSILKKAFSGQLVPQDPNDEPASVLLERIRAEKAAHATNAKQIKDTANRSKRAVT